MQFKIAISATVLVVCIVATCWAEEPVAEMVCTPRSEFKMDCNTCRCNDDGSGAACTRRRCPVFVVMKGPESEQTSEPAIARNRRDVTTEACIPGTSFKKDCNTCRCNLNGWACTRRACPVKASAEPETTPPPAAERKRREISSGRQICEPKTFYTKDCNRCRCNDKGTHEACTKRLCPQRPSDTIVEIPTETPSPIA